MVENHLDVAKFRGPEFIPAGHFSRQDFLEFLHGEILHRVLRVDNNGDGVDGYLLCLGHALALPEVLGLFFGQRMGQDCHTGFPKHNGIRGRFVVYIIRKDRGMGITEFEDLDFLLHYILERGIAGDDQSARCSRISGRSRPLAPLRVTGSQERHRHCQQDRNQYVL